MMTPKAKTSREELIVFAMKRIDAKLNHFVREGRIRESDADDVRQDAIIAVLERLNEYDANRETLEKTFVNAVVKNAFKYYFAARKYWKRKDCLDVDSLPESAEPTVNDAAAGEMNELEQIYLKIDLASVRERLSDKQQAVFELMGTHNLSDMAAILGISAGTVSNRINEIREIAQSLFI